MHKEERDQRKERRRGKEEAQFHDYGSCVTGSVSNSSISGGSSSGCTVLGSSGGNCAVDRGNVVTVSERADATVRGEDTDSEVGVTVSR